VKRSINYYGAPQTGRFDRKWMSLASSFSLSGHVHLRVLFKLAFPTFQFKGISVWQTACYFENSGRYLMAKKLRAAWGVKYNGTRNVAWVQPTLIAQVEFRAWTSDRKLRHASFKGLREIQDNADVYRL
jgi:hypothetical protein